MQLHINPGDPQPIYRQIQRQISAAIAGSRLRPGEALPSAREVAERLVISPLSVQKAYEELVLEGLCRAGEGDGYRVATLGIDAGGNGLRGHATPELSEKELRLARDIQRRLLPPGEVDGEGFALAARNYPARVVAGDFYDVIRHADGSVGVVVADVAGKGFGASLIMASVKAMMPFVAAERSVEETLRELNRRLHDELGSREFVALAYARFDPARGRVRFANAGLPDPYRLRPGRTAEALAVSGPRLPLGIRGDVGYCGLDLPLLPGERLLLLTDGPAEARTPQGEPFGYEALSGLLGAGSSSSPRFPGSAAESLGRWLDHLLEEVWEATGPDLEDDWTALVLQPVLGFGPGAQEPC